MPDGRLVIGPRRYSSWSMRGWLAVELAGLAVEVVVVPITGAGNSPGLRDITSSGLVPYLEHGGNRVWESLAICEYCAEIAPGLWPADARARAEARSIAAEMHAGFRELRSAMPMNLGRAFPGRGRTAGAVADIARVETIWRETRERFGAGGAFLFGTGFGAADAMYAPVVARLLTYQPELGAAARAYCAAVRGHPLVAAWYRAAADEPESWRIARYENPA